MISLFCITLLAFTLSVAFCLGFRGLAREWYLIDIPDARKRHDGNVPLCGGIAVFLSFFVAAFLTPSLAGSANAIALLPGLFLILVTGVMDDRFNLPVAPRLAMQLIAAFLIIGVAGITQVHLGLVTGITQGTPLPATEITGAILEGPLFLLIALAFVVGLVNAVNMSDGVDGLAGSASAAAFFWLAAICFWIDENRLGLQTIALSAACTGFLFFNMRHRWRAKASLFLGDGGSTFLGATLSGIILMLTNAHAAVAFPIVLWVVVVPVIDTLSLIVRRLSARRSPFSPDRQHLHHLLIDAGLSHGQTAIAVMALNFLAGAIAYLAIRMEIPAWPMLIALIIPVIAHTLFVLHTNRGLRPIVAAPAGEPAQTSKANVTLPGATS
ncbi:MraY family glycosyltransferase [Brucella rhizosphaerae]|uniref:Glycosyl transferase 4 family protein n=1 Tax=Brucella rhizosphaerae TaxID=571254 RepID=A0A256FUP3_9HYPH|nr:MraY family glycosyltransferase [Brucella rhizosphaerae]OYR18592.1 glycosyl transferase 4 family protein [Brucella rhizosphaerae]